MTKVVRPAIASRRPGLDRRLGGRVDRGGGVVEDQDARVGEQGAGDRDPLALAAGEGQAALADPGLVAVRQVADEGVGLGAAGRLFDLLEARLGPRVGDVLGDAGGEQEAVVGDEGDLAAQAADVDLAHVGAVDEHRALARVVEAGDQRHQAGLARARGADQGDRAARLDLEVDPLQRVDRLFAVRPRARARRPELVVGERDAAHLDPAAARGQRRRPGRALDPRLAVEDLEEAVAGGDRPLRHPHRDAEHPHRPGEDDHVGVEGGEVAEAEAAVDHLAAADQQHQRDPELRQQPDQRREEGLQPGRVDALVEDPGDGALEAVELVLLAGEGLDDADPGDVLLGFRGQLGDPLLDLLQGRPRDPVVARGGEDDQRRRGEGDQRQDRVDRDHHDGDQGDRQQVLGDEDQPVAEEEADRLQVDGRPRHQLPGLLGVEEAELEPLQVGVEELAQVELDRQRDLAGDHPPDHGQAEAEDAGADDRQRQGQQVGLVAVLDRVDRAPDQPRDQHRHPHRQPGEGQRAPELAAVGAQEAHQAAVGPHHT